MAFDIGSYQGLGFQLFPYLDQLSGGNTGVRDAFRAGVPLANEFFNFNTLGRVSDTAPSFAGDPSILNTGETLARRRAESFIGGQRTPEAQSRLDLLGGLAKRAQSYSPEEQQLLELRKQNLGGLTQEEEQLLRDQGQVGLNRGLNSALRGVAARFPGATGASRTIAANPVIQSFADAQRGLERDIGTQKIDRRREALNAYDTTVGNLQNSLYGRSVATGEAFNTAGFNQQQFETQDRANRLSAFEQAQNYAREDQLKRQQYNLSQLAAEKAGQLGLIFGSGQFGAAEQARKDAVSVAKEAIAKGIPFDPAAIFKSLAGALQSNSFGATGAGTGGY